MPHSQSFHALRNIPQIRQKLLQFYDANKRDLEWRIPVDDVQLRAYRVWVSEIMLQQTRVETVKEYYRKWIQKWPTMNDFVKATLEEVHAIWAGLGYYSRATRLLEGAKVVVEKMDGIIPSHPEELQKIPGVGPYTAGAISSIAFNQPVPLVDGNVIRVLSRMTALGGDPKSKLFTQRVWQTAAEVVDSARPGCFNQSLMELGATVCTPTNPSCKTCPVNANCTAYIEENNTKKRSIEDDIEDLCTLCPEVETIRVVDFPTKVAKKEARKEEVVVGIIEVNGEFLLVQNPSKGLLANLWDFPVIPLDGTTTQNRGERMKDFFHIHNACTKSVGNTIHKFSHIHRTMNVEYMELKSKDDIKLDSLEDRPVKWLSKENFSDGSLGLPITHSKAWDLYQKDQKLKSKKTDFFKPKKAKLK
jgi:A/G-specific adenine glycosylase